MSVEHQPSWEQVAAFLHVMRQGSFSGAARSLRVAQPTVRRRIEALESSLGSPLFSRASNGLTPTDVAHRILPFAETMEANSRSLVREASAAPDVVEGVVRLAVGELMGAEFIPEALQPLHARHPALSIELVLSNDIADVSRREADVAVRMAPPQGASLVARKLGTVTLGFFAAPAYLANRAAPTTLEALVEHDLVGLDADDQLLTGLAALGLTLSPRDFRLRTDHVLAYLAAIRSGLGIGVTHLPLSRRPPLVRVLPELGLPVDLWLVAHQDTRRIRRIRVVLDHLATALLPYVDDPIV